MSTDSTPTPIFTQIRVAVFTRDSLRAIASCKVADAIWLTGLRVCAGKHGLWLAMPSKKKKDGEYEDVYFPASKTIRDELQRVVLAAYAKECGIAGIDPESGEAKP